MTTIVDRPGKSKSELTRDAANDLELLASLGNKIRHHHNEVVAHESQALKDACLGGQFAAEAYPLWHELRASGKCKLKWVDWLQSHVGVGKRTIETYQRIHENWHLLKDLPSHQQSIRAAIRFLDGEERTIPSNEISLKAALLVEMSEKHELQNATPAKLVAIMNDLLKAAHLRKIVKVG